MISGIEGVLLEILVDEVTIDEGFVSLVVDVTNEVVVSRTRIQNISLNILTAGHTRTILSV